MFLVTGLICQVEIQLIEEFLLTQKSPSGGGFSKLAGSSYIELVEDTSKKTSKFSKIDYGEIQDLFIWGLT